MSTQMLLGLEATAAKHRADLERLAPLAVELALKAGRSGVTVADCRIVALQRGLLTGGERGRALAYLGKLCETAGLVPTTEYRRSIIEKSNGNLQRVWRHVSHST